MSLVHRSRRAVWCRRRVATTLPAHDNDTRRPDGRLPTHHHEPRLEPAPASPLTSAPDAAPTQPITSLDAALVATARTQHGMLTTAQANRAWDLRGPCWWPWSRRACSGTRAAGCTPSRRSPSTSRGVAPAALCGGVPALPRCRARRHLRAAGARHHGLGRAAGIAEHPATGQAGRGHERVLGAPRAWRDGLDEWGPASAPAAALVQHAVDHGIVTGVVSADAALREGTVIARRARGRVAAVATWPHSSRAASMLRLVDGVASRWGSPGAGSHSRWPAST